MSTVAPRHLLGAAIAAASAALLLVGCTSASSEGTPKDEGGTLTVWFPGNNQTEIDLVNNTIVPAFEKESGTKVQVTFVDWGDMSTKLNAAFAAGTAPDVFGHGGAAVADFVANDRIVDLTSRIKSLPKKDQQDLGSALDGGVVHGKNYTIPTSRTGNLIMYNAADFTAAGLDPDKPPTTWEALKSDAAKLTQRDGSGTITRSGLLLPSQAIGRQQTFQTLLKGAGGDALNKAGTEAVWDSAAGKKALEYFASLYDGPAAVSANLGEDFSNAPAGQQPLVQGTASMTMVQPTSATQIKAAAPDKDLRIMQPLGFEGEHPAALGGAGTHLMINADSKRQDAAWKFMTYLIDPEVNAKYTEGIGAVPLRASAVDSAYVKGSPIIQAFLKAAPDYSGNPNVPSWVQVRDVLDKNLEQALHRTVTPAAALAAAKADADRILKANG